MSVKRTLTTVMIEQYVTTLWARIVVPVMLDMLVLDILLNAVSCGNLYACLLVLKSNIYKVLFRHVVQGWPI